MALPKKKPVIEKPEFNIKDLRSELGLTDQNVAEKELEWIPFKKAYFDALGVPGVARGYSTQFRGFSDTGKSTAIYETITGAQKLGDFVVIIDTEGNFNWEHAGEVGFKFDVEYDKSDVDKEYPNYTGDFLFVGNKDLLEMFQYFDYDSGKKSATPLRFVPVIEDVAKLMNTILDKQAKGELQRNITFVWDSIGSISCFKSAVSNTNNNMWNAGALKRSFESILNFRIPASRRIDSPYINTFVSVQKIWLQQNPGGQPTVMQSGGDGFKYGVRMIVHMGGKTTSGNTKLKATNKGRDYQFGVQVKIECVKNHINGIERKGEICSTPHGFVNPAELNDYKKDKIDFINAKLGTSFEDFDIVKMEPEERDLD